METRKNRKFLGVKFNCCQVYTRIYMNRNGTHYEGGCPRCGRLLRVRVDPINGVNTRFLESV
jgi:hypothetical protein